MYDMNRKNNVPESDDRSLPNDWVMYEKKKYSIASTLTDREGSLAFDIVVIVVTLILSVFLVYTTLSAYAQYNEMQDNIKEQIALKESYNDELDYLKELESNQKALKISEEAWSQTLPETSMKEEIVVFNNSIVDESGGTFSDLRFSGEEEMDNGIIEVPFSIKIECTFNQLINILNEYYSSYRLINIDKISMIGDDYQGGNADVEISAVCYYK